MGEEERAFDWKYRRCSVPGCEYKEIRGSREGHFVEGRFVCIGHALVAAMEKRATALKAGNRGDAT